MGGNQPSSQQQEDDDDDDPTLQMRGNNSRNRIADVHFDGVQQQDLLGASSVRTALGGVATSVVCATSRSLGLTTLLWLCSWALSGPAGRLHVHHPHASTVRT